MEYGHRMWGRSIGAFFYLPAIGFWASGMLTPALKKRVMLAGGLLGFQGSIFVQLNDINTIGVSPLFLVA